MRTLASLLLALIFLKCLLLYKTTRALPLTELRRRARVSHSKRTHALYKLLAFQTSFKIVILMLGGISGAIIFAAAANVGIWLCTLLLLAVTWLVLDDQFVVKPGGWLWAVSGYVAQAVLPIVNFLQPLLSRLSNRIGHPKIHSGIYEREDLLGLLDRQKSQVDNRISDIELKAARGALSFGDKAVLSIMTPRKIVVWVNGDDLIGPKLMDDLHKTGFIRFPVTVGKDKSINPNVIGTLHLTDLLKNLEKPGKVRDIMKKDAHFINESDSLLQALDGFLKAGQHLLIVVNNFEEVVGVLTLEDVLSQILGSKISDEFDRYDDMRAVAGHQKPDKT